MTGWSEVDGLADGVDATWLLTHGAAMAWRYAMSVQPALADLRAAADGRDWPLCVESCAMVLRGLVHCRQVGRGLTGRPTDDEFQLWLATAQDGAARALRELPWAPHASEAEAAAAREVAEREDRVLRAELPFEMPEVRSADGRGATMRLTAEISRARRDRGLGGVDWNREGV